MKSQYIYIIILWVLFIGCENLTENNQSKLQISFQNNSVQQLNKLTVSDKLIGDLNGKSSTEYFSFESFGFDTGMPDENASAEINGKMVTNLHRGFWCGTEKITIDSGKYLIKINIVDTVLILSCENAPIIQYP